MYSTEQSRIIKKLEKQTVVKKIYENRGGFDKIFFDGNKTYTRATVTYKYYETLDGNKKHKVTIHTASNVNELVNIVI